MNAEHASSRKPSRAEAWVAFAAGAAGVTKDGYPIGAPGSAGLADGLLAIYDQKLAAGDLDDPND